VVTPPKINRKDAKNAKALCGLGCFAVKKNSLPFSSSVVTERSWAIPLRMRMETAPTSSGECGSGLPIPRIGTTSREMRNESHPCAPDSHPKAAFIGRAKSRRDRNSWAIYGHRPGRSHVSAG